MFLVTIFYISSRSVTYMKLLMDIKFMALITYYILYIIYIYIYIT